MRWPDPQCTDVSAIAEIDSDSVSEVETRALTHCFDLHLRHRHDAGLLVSQGGTSCALNQ